VSAQFSLIRTVLVHASGNELSLCMLITFWLLFGGAGSLTAAALFKNGIKVKDPFPVLYLLFGILLTAGIFWAGTVRRVMFGYSFSLDFSRILVLTALCAFPVSFPAGMLFVTAVSTFQKYTEKAYQTATPVFLYLVEALGSFAGGITLSFILAGRLPTLSIATATSGLVFLSGALLFCSSRKCFIKNNSMPKPTSGSKPLVTTLFLVFFAASSLFTAVPGLSSLLNRLFLQVRFPGEGIVFYADSRYQNFVVTKRKQNTYFYQNGSLSYFSQGGEREQEIVHIPMLQQKNPGDVLLIGNGWGFFSGEILKHPVISLDIAIEDKKVHHLGSAFISAQQKGLTDKRVTVYYGDPFRIPGETKKIYSSVFIDPGPPDSLLASRYYTAGFLKSIKNHLRDDGIVVFTLPNSPNYLTDALLYVNASIYRTVQTVFADVVVIPGEYAQNIYIAGDDLSMLTNDAGRLTSVLRQRGIRATWISASSLITVLDRMRIEKMNDQIAGARLRAINTAERPIALFYSLENRQMKSAGRMSLRFLTKFKFYHFLIAIIPVALIILLASGPRSTGTGMQHEARRTRGSTLLFFAACAGFSGMAVELSVLFSFQVIFGYIYGFIGVFTGIFMGGLAGGALLSVRIRKKERALYTATLLFIVMIAVYVFITRNTGGLMNFGGVHLVTGSNTDFSVYTVFIITMLAGGLSTGFSFGTVLYLYTGPGTLPPAFFRSTPGEGPKFLSGEFTGLSKSPITGSVKKHSGAPSDTLSGDTENSLFKGGNSAVNKGSYSGPVDSIPSKRPGFVYAADLFGGSFGGLFASILFLPIVGITGTALYSAVLLAASLAVLAAGKLWFNYR